MSKEKDTEVIYDAEFGDRSTGKAVRIQATATNFKEARNEIMEQVINEGNPKLVNVLGYIGYLESCLEDAVEAAKCKQARIELLLDATDEIAKQDSCSPEVRGYLKKLKDADGLANLLLQNEEAAEMFMSLVGEDDE